ncbi:lysine N(6)-hydroxylase/L-ornithine N(5)-oxygenase family protein [Allonocardiopsis opalescens]|uniref:L-lysine N6-monooxygenase MbtG n=1 Tax=Allonocardiopsis opalescens TaxID=1144618 RepID=A0A2T0QE52_9ACTN|nr:SidA/IucD/PvdA family monooxygenase [Allonocardiopsis opalescens]PRY02172.1 lysine N6-hydroxylase [Allonocardiopsis opalescens]
MSTPNGPGEPGARSGAHAFDLVGIGLGPFNLGLAALAEPVEGLDTLFLEAEPSFSWHPGLLLEGARLQVPFLADLVSLVDPTSRWSFLNYLREHDRLFPFYFAERFHMPRVEYDAYCGWVARELERRGRCRFGAPVASVRWDGDAFAVEVRPPGGAGYQVRARDVVLGIGTEPALPRPLAELLAAEGGAAPPEGEVCHSGDYLRHAATLLAADDITVVGSGQSGAEVFLELLRDPAPRRLRWITRSPAFAPMEYSKLGLEHFTPDYTRYFHGLPEPVRDRLVPRQWQLYKAISADTIADIHDALYQRSLRPGLPEATLMPGVELSAAERDGGGYRLHCHHLDQDRAFSFRTRRIVAATGYRPRRPDLLDPLAAFLGTDGRGRLRVGADYRVATDPKVRGGLYVQNAEEHTHGVGAPDLGLGAWRSATILNAVTGRTVYRLPERTAYTTFGVDGSDGAGPGERGPRR